jgi:hypothetical protein
VHHGVPAIFDLSLCLSDALSSFDVRRLLCVFVRCFRQVPGLPPAVHWFRGLSLLMWSNGARDPRIAHALSTCRHTQVHSDTQRQTNRHTCSSTHAHTHTHARTHPKLTHACKHKQSQARTRATSVSSSTSSSPTWPRSATRTSRSWCNPSRCIAVAGALQRGATNIAAHASGVGAGERHGGAAGVVARRAAATVRALTRTRLY